MNDTPSTEKIPTFNPIQGLFFRDFANDHIPDILEEVYMKKVYDRFVAGRKDLIVVDIGQNVGVTSFFFKDYATRVIGFEPSLQHRETCKTMLEYNKITNVETLPYAISNKNGTTKFYHYPNSTSFSLTNMTDGKDFEEVETITIDKIFAVAKIDKIDILKIDVEGEESRIITSPEFKKNIYRMPVLLGEWHNWTDMSKNMFAQTLTDLGYTFRWRYDTRASVFEATLT